ncbi:hypothetical protein [Streptomyces spiramyceticus]|uniref:hypothetical protein n=1 Tax=Streptomyces spiramyceticus TaxID=299717 RepID=UPI00237A87A6|nr:hypothetical protein [Streptomyces spiramyceticus]
MIRPIGWSDTLLRRKKNRRRTSPPPEDEPGPLTGELAEAAKVLLSLRQTNRGLHLGVREAQGLAETAAEWLRRGVSPGELRRALCAGLPGEGVRSVVGFLRYRLVQKMPEVPSVARLVATAAPAPGRDRAELVLCAGPGDDHAFRPVEGETVCGLCRMDAAARAAGFEPGRRAEVPLTPWRDRVAAITTA